MVISERRQISALFAVTMHILDIAIVVVVVAAAAEAAAAAAAGSS